MFRYRTRLFFHALILVWALAPISALPQPRWQYNSNAEELFEGALDQYSSGQFGEAAAGFDNLIKLPLHQRTTAAYVMLGKSYFQGAQFRESVKILKQFIDTYPESFYIDDAHYTLGLCYETQHRYDDALVQFLAALETTEDLILRNRARSYCEHLAAEKVPILMLNEILHETHFPDNFDFLSIKIAEKYAAMGNIVAAEKILEPVVSRTPPSLYSAEAQTLLGKIRLGMHLKVGVLLPLMNHAVQKNLKAYGEEFLQGIQFALEEQRALHSALINAGLDVRDTERDPAVAAKQALELADDPQVVAMIGPIFNNEATGCAAIANARGIPLITPTANADGIAGVGPFVFQANPDMTTRGKAAAQYAVSEFGLQTLAVLAPNDGGGKVMAEAFAHEALSLGATIIAKEWYPPNTKDLQEYLLRIRNAALMEMEPLLSFAENITQTDIMRMVRAGASPRTIDSLMDRSATISVYKLFGPDGKRIADSLRLPTFAPKDTSENFEMPATGIQGLYVPINSAEEIGIVASQVAYFNIETQLLGSSEWHNRIELDANNRYTDGVIFFSDFHVDQADQTYASFARRWFEKNKKRVSTNVVLGYDVMNLLLSLIFKGITTRDQLAQSLSAYERFRGLHGIMSFTKGRVNSDLCVLQYSQAEIRKLTDFSVH